MFSYKDFFERHKTYVCPEYTGKTRKCQQCDRTFKTAQQLNNHTLIHSDVRNYKCTECKKSFKQPSALKSHKLIHSGEKPYVCGISGCQKAFRTSGNLHSHTVTHTGEKPHVCQYCNKSFTQSSSLKTHLVSHRKEKPFNCKCEDCGKEFVFPGNYRRHLKVHEKNIKKEQIEIESDDGSDTEESEKITLEDENDGRGSDGRTSRSECDYVNLVSKQNHLNDPQKMKLEHLNNESHYNNDEGQSDNGSDFDDPELPTFCEISSLFS